MDTLVDIRKITQQREEEELEATKIESLKMEKEERKRRKAEQRTKHKNDEGQTSVAPQAVQIPLPTTEDTTNQQALVPEKAMEPEKKEHREGKAPVT